MRNSLIGLTLHVTDVERACAFYARIPGAEIEVHQPGTFAIVRIGDARIGLIRGKVPGFHLEIATTDLDAMHADLTAAGFPPQSPPVLRPWGERNFTVRDPDGYAVEFEQEEQPEETYRPAAPETVGK